MNPYGLERLARQRTDDCRAEAARHRSGAARRDHAGSIRHRTGWALVQIGLSLISTSPGTPRTQVSGGDTPQAGRTGQAGSRAAFRTCG